jgi:fructose-specific phosphotransferase system IIA component
MFLISEDLIDINYFALDKASCLNDMIQLLHEQDIIQSQQNFSAKLWEREKMMPTGIGRHIAIPHARSSSVRELALAFFRLKNDLDFDAIDDEPVKFIFMIAIPENMSNDYMQLLKAISNFCHSPENLERLKAAEKKSEVKSILESITNSIQTNQEK